MPALGGIPALGLLPSVHRSHMNSLRNRMIAVAVLACLFAVGMAALLNYFKYRSTADRIVSGRLIVLGKHIENSIQASVALGIAFVNPTFTPKADSANCKCHADT